MPNLQKQLWGVSTIGENSLTKGNKEGILHIGSWDRADLQLTTSLSLKGFIIFFPKVVAEVWFLFSSLRV
jgi:hypothetical protein